MFEKLKHEAHQLATQQRVKRVLAQCMRLLTVPAEANSVPIAQAISAKIETFGADEYEAFFDALATRFNPAKDDVLSAAQAYAQTGNARNLIALSKACEPPRQELFRRLNRGPYGTQTLVNLRRRLLSDLHRNAEWKAIEYDLLHLLSSWFNPGFLQMRGVDWNSRAHILEQIIQHEAVHAIDGWDDLRRRLQPDRRCFAFFHPQLPERPLIFVEVALLAEIPDAIAPLIDKKAEILPPNQFKVAAFYSISNCEPGLRGVSLGNFLIKHVAAALKEELPQIKTFCTLSPIPSLRAWLEKTAPNDAEESVRKASATLGNVAALNAAAAITALSVPKRAALAQLTSAFLSRSAALEAGDPVARFHLENGARLERVNLAANVSPAGLKQSLGTMVNYLYDIDKVEAQRAAYVSGKVSMSRNVAKML
jgi:malonyl-CoA decarboxylase